MKKEQHLDRRVFSNGLQSDHHRKPASEWQTAVNWAAW